MISNVIWNVIATLVLLYLQSLASIPDPVLTVTALAVSGDDKPEGYETTVYLTQAAEKDEVQLLVSQIGEANWRLCIDADVDRTNNKSKVLMLIP